MIFDTIHNQALRLCLGAFKTSPIESLYVEANKPSLYDRREKLALQYALNVKSTPTNIAYNTIFNAQHSRFYQERASKIPSFSIRMEDVLKNVNINLQNIGIFSYPDSPTWLLPIPYADLDLCQFVKADTSPDIFKSYFLEKLVKPL